MFRSNHSTKYGQRNLFCYDRAGIYDSPRIRSAFQRVQRTWETFPLNSLSSQSFYAARIFPSPRYDCYQISDPVFQPASYYDTRSQRKTFTTAIRPALLFPSSRRGNLSRAREIYNMCAVFGLTDTLFPLFLCVLSALPR